MVYRFTSLHCLSAKTQRDMTWRVSQVHVDHRHRAKIADALLKAAKNLLVSDSVDVLTIGRHVICVPGRSQLYDRRQRYSAASGSSPYRMPCDVSRR
jgi:hypothetical protein